ncbi:MAG: GNAT family N-acetyltransferase, partial [Gluconobacter cerinus]|uniref:GNAT family N-acetyltransferase n=1 Tax=Gluconobacter cerinus TaxID=38307 RepID=UPI0039E9B5A1
MLATNNSGRILGFCGVHERNIEMLFISPESRGLGIGSLLLEYAVNNQGAVKVDVNEQNVQALGFYEHLGFNVVGRSPLDGYGKPYPLLHMELKNLIAPTRRGRIG